MRSDAELAGELARDAGRLALRMRREGLAVDTKRSRTDLVTDADRAAERMILDRLSAERPDDGLLGEEGGSQVGSTGREWVIDPVDGTFDFVHGLPWWCSAVGLRSAGETLLGAVYDAEGDRLWVGGIDEPTTLNGESLPVLGDRPLAELAVATYLHPPLFADDRLRTTWERVVGRAATVRILGSSSMELAAVADGRLGVWLHQSVQPWDWHPGAGLVIGAGGVTARVAAGGVEWSVAGPQRAVAEVVGALTS